MIDDVRQAYAALHARPIDDAGPDALAVLRVSDDPEVYLGLDAEGRSHLLVPSGTGEVPAPGIATLEVNVRPLRIDRRTITFLDVVCLYRAVAEVFDHFVVAVIELLDGGATADAALASVLEGWKRFLVSAGGPPGRDRLAQIFGELLVVQEVVSTAPATGLSAWSGPHGGRHDFRRGALALEVKTTLAHTSRLVTIHGLDQLVEPEGGRLVLHLVRLEEVASGGLDVARLVDDTLAAGAPAEELFRLLAAAGLPPADVTASAGVRFDVRERISFPVDPRMPRIVPSTFAAGAVPVGVVDVSYVIDLDHCLDSALPDADHHDLVSELGAGM
jgi:hypothetical protein